MSVVNTSLPEISAPERRETGLLPAIAEFLHAFARIAFDTYRPERHYMRGPGPACAAKWADQR